MHSIYSESNVTLDRIRERVHALDILRCLAVMLVVFAHSPFTVSNSIAARIFGWGSIGVDLFFVLSGYLISSQWFHEIKAPHQGILTRFFIRRIFKIWPNYFVVIFLLIGMHGSEGAGLTPLWRYILFLQNFYSTQGFGPSWSLCIEEHFYLIFPFLTLFASKKGGKLPIRIFVIFAVMGTVLRALFWIGLRPDKLHLSDPTAAESLYYLYFYHPTFMRLDGLVFGVGVAAIERFRPLIWSRLIRIKNGWPVISAALFAFTIFVSSGTFTRHLSSGLIVQGAPPGRGFFGLTFGVLGIDLSCALLLIWALNGDSLLGRLRLPFVNRIALLSYAIYLTHSEVMIALIPWVPKMSIPSEGILASSVMLVSVLVVGQLLYWTVEKPFMKIRNKVLAWHGRTVKE